MHDLSVLTYGERGKKAVIHDPDRSFSENGSLGTKRKSFTSPL